MLEMVPISYVTKYTGPSTIVFVSVTGFIRPINTVPLPHGPIDPFLGSRKSSLSIFFKKRWLVCRKVGIEVNMLQSNLAFIKSGPVPDACLKDVRRLVSKFVLSFARASSWEIACRPKALGGLGLIDLGSQ
ncbi:hypothetical protein INT46_002564 [Mucor plumbeus]|uniref:Uncharacterized protein n=1 Tax=Mucor plumbeus TaxID=97098 RepID=A0A8H7QKU2_9FUNG|nr:hypothetical protein INT46_002564 [Mucor plumbeus]